MHKKYHIIINQSSGTVLRMGADVLRQKIEESGIDYASLSIVDSKDIYDTIDDVNNADDTDPLLVGGGDGTIKCAASILLNKENNKRPMCVLPLGTMNLMAHDMGIPINIDDALTAYKSGSKIHKMDVGYVNDKMFLCCVATGSIAKAAELREEKRSENTPALFAQLGLFLLENLDKKHWHRVKMHIGRKRYKFRSSALVISNNIYIPAKEVKDITNLIRPKLDEGVLGIMSAKPYNMWDKLRFLSKIRLGNWRKDPVIRTWQGHTALIDIYNKSTSNMITLDGEIIDMPPPYHFSLDPKALTLASPVKENT